MNRTPPLAVLLLSALLGPASAFAQTVEAPFDTSYVAANLGVVRGVPFSYGGITFKAGDPNTMLIGGSAFSPTGQVYQIGVIRDAEDHIVGFNGTATILAAAPFIDGGLSYGPDDILFFTRYPTNEIGQILPGTSLTHKVVALSPLGVKSSVGTVRFVPPGFPGAGTMKTLTYNTGDWNDITYVPDGAGAYNLTAASLRGVLTGKPEGLIYVPLGSPGFAAPSVAVCEYGAGVVSTYQVDTRGDAILATRQVFLSGVPEAEGAAVDPVTNDLVFTTQKGVDNVVVVRGFATGPLDADADGEPDATDNCPAVFNPEQRDTDADGAGDACDADDDNDGYPDVDDAFPTDATEHADTDGDGVGDNADRCPLDNPNDGDGDNVCSSTDTCPTVWDPDQADFDGDGLGDLCDPDWDGDGVDDGVDLCIGFDDAVDTDGDGIPDGPDANGDPCDICPADGSNDADSDGICGDVDNCPVIANVDQADFDADGPGDACDDDDDNDGLPDLADLFPYDSTEWADTDLDGVGDNGDLCLGNDASGDADFDGVCSDIDAFPSDPDETADRDGDGVGDNSDAFDDDPTEWDDTDLDGVGDNSDACAGDDASGDTDGDLVCDDSDLCPTDPLDLDVDGDLICDVVDTCMGATDIDTDGDQVCDDLDLCLGNDATGDSDMDGFCDGTDNCPVDANADQADADADGVGDLCEADSDHDGVLDDVDVCPNTFDPDQANTDLDDLGDACDADDDNDSVFDVVDNCPLFANVDQLDSDWDGLGDACDGDDDADGVLDGVDLCPGTPLNVLFDATGCSGVQRIDLTCGQSPCSGFFSQLRYVACVVHASNGARNAGLITRRERGAIVGRAVFGCWL